jgi:hypothetical protein
MVPPLQAKLELLKKSEGVPNVYDDEAADELTVIRKNAGITTAKQEANTDINPGAKTIQYFAWV